MASAPSPANKPWWRRWFGRRAEHHAAEFLQRLGYEVLARNYYVRGGEIDVVARDGETVVFVEVRSTGRNDTERPAASVDAEKQRRLTQLALQYLQHKNWLGRPARFDVVVLSWPPDRGAPKVVHYRNAFDASDRFQFFS